jgi:hypothetical protein
MLHLISTRSRLSFPSRSSSHALWRGAVALACLVTLLTGGAAHSGAGARSALLVAHSGAAARSGSLELPRSSPEAQGIASADILAFVQAADEQVDTMNSFMLVRHGHVVAEAWWAPYDAQTPHILLFLE